DHLGFEHFGLHGHGSEAAQQPDLDLGAAFEATHVDEVAIDQIAEAARRRRAAVACPARSIVGKMMPGPACGPSSSCSTKPGCSGGDCWKMSPSSNSPNRPPAGPAEGQ